MTIAAQTYCTGGAAVTRELIRLGFRTLYALPGIQNDELFNALYDRRDEIRVVHTRHEQGAAYMALGAALATGRPAACSVVPGPGFLNASAALATAFGLNAPLLFLTGQIPLAEIGRERGALHEIPDQLGMLRALTKFAVRIEHSALVPHALNTAYAALSSGRPRPVGVEVPMDVLAQVTPLPPSPNVPRPSDPPVDEAVLTRIADTLSKATHPLIFVGSGAQDVSADVRALAEYLQAPVVSYRTGRGIVDSRSPLSVVLPAARELWTRSDVVLALGSTVRLPLQNWAASAQRKLLRIDVDPSSHGRICKPHLALTARLEDALPLLRQQIESTRAPANSRREELLSLRADWESRTATLEPQISYLKVIRDCLDETGIFVDELTQVGFASRLVYPVYHPRTFLSAGHMGTLGWGFPTALGAKCALPDRPVVSVTGDGGFLFAASELATAVQHRIGLVTIVFNNGRYGNVHQMQRDLYGGRFIASDLVNPDFVRLAESFGAKGLRAQTPDALSSMLERALADDLPTVIEVPVGDMPSVDQFR